MPHIILKKTFKTKPSGFQVANEKSFSLHGYVPKDVVDALNNQLKLIKFSGSKSSVSVTFKMDSYGHYSFPINHDQQKNNEEDIVVAILDCMETLGYNFKFQYDTEMSSEKVTGSSRTSRELFIFQK
jgi:hypothetical protein